MITALKRGRPQETVPAGTTWTITQSGQWEVPATGQYQVELHGGGGGACINYYYVNTCASGGGSGQIYTLPLVKGEKISVDIGAGGSGSNNGVGLAGGTTTFGNISIAGGGGGVCNDAIRAGGAASGDLATAGVCEYLTTVSGGLGNKNKPSQPYGNGGGGDWTKANSGNPGAAIITFLGA